MKKLILLAILAGLAWWYFDYSHRMTETQIRASFDDDIAAMQRFDADSLCAGLAEEFSGDEVTREGDDLTRRHYDKKGLCERTRKSIALMQRLSNASGGLLTLDIEMEIKSIELSVDRKQATVETVSTARLGDMTLARDRTTSHLVRRHGRILNTGGESRVWAYRPQ